MNGEMIRKIHDDEYYLFYEMMVGALRTDDVVDGINKTLSLLKHYLYSDSIILYRKNQNNEYVHFVSDSDLNHLSNIVTSLVNKTSSLTENKGSLFLDLNLSEEYKNIMLISLKTENYDYVLLINNFDNTVKLDDDFWNKLKESMLIILKRAEMYERNIKAVNTDLLTGLDNRNSYETRIQRIDTEGNFVYALFDLFRLKYVNDNYGHSVGDEYIKNVANILNKYWPKYNVETVDGFEKKTETGHVLYRIGGDEFILITKNEELALTKIKAELASSEVSMLDLGVSEKLPLGLNYGITIHDKDDHIKKTYEDADKLMSENKTLLYKKLDLERRK